MQRQEPIISGIKSSDLEFSLNTIEEAIADIRDGKVVIVVDDEDRENEGDFICAASCVTPEIINFMATHGRGLICTPIEQRRAEEMGLTMMVSNNTALHETAFTVSIDLVGQNCTTGISAYDRATGIKALIDPSTPPEAFAKPGHIFPLIAKEGGVLRRIGHTEAAVDLARLAGHAPAGVLVEILNPDGTMARLPQLLELANKLNLKIISIKDLVAFRLTHENLVKKDTSKRLEGNLSDFDLHIFSDTSTGNHHIALTYGIWSAEDEVLARIYSATDHDLVLGLLTGAYGSRYDRIVDAIRNEGRGIFLLIRREQHEDGFMDQLDQFINRIKEIPGSVQDSVLRDIGIGAQIIRQLGVRKLRVMTNNPRPNVALQGYDLEIVDYVSF